MALLAVLWMLGFTCRGCLRSAPVYTVHYVVQVIRASSSCLEGRKPMQELRSLPNSLRLSLSCPTISKNSKPSDHVLKGVEQRMSEAIVTDHASKCLELILLPLLHPSMLEGIGHLYHWLSLLRVLHVLLSRSTQAYTLLKTVRPTLSHQIQAS